MIDEASLQALTRRIVDEFHPVRVVLFGSQAYGTPRPDSDVDLLVIMRFEGSPLRFAVDMAEQINSSFSMDLLVRTPNDIEQRYRFGDPLIREALDKGRVLYEEAA